MSTLYQDLPLTQFPGNLDTFTTWFNITATDGPLIAQYQSALQAGNTTLANQILAQIPSASQKIIKAVDLNTLTQALQAVERFYLTDIEPYIETQQESWLATIQQFSYQGTWAVGTAYQTNNIVSYTSQGLTLLFIATATPPVGTAPNNTAYWRVLTIQGQTGPSGVGLSYRQEWSSSTSYSTSDAVTYDGILWMALQPSTNIQPGSNEEYWQAVITLAATTYPIQSTQPTGQDIGSLWFNTQDNPTQYYYLEELGNPASAATVWNGYEAYDDQGNLITGEFETYTKEEIDTEKVAIIESYPVNTGESVTAGQVVDLISDGTVTSTPTSPTYTITTSGTPSTAIALESGSAGDTIPVIFTGTTSAPFITRDQTIQGTDGGVFGYGILDGILGVTAKQEKDSQGNTKIATGSYTGTGTGGSDNPNQITLPFSAKMFIVQYATGAASNAYMFIWSEGVTYAYSTVKYSATTGGSVFVSATDNLISWYAIGSDPAIQCNVSGASYSWIAFG